MAQTRILFKYLIISIVMKKKTNIRGAVFREPFDSALFIARAEQPFEIRIVYSAIGKYGSYQ